MLEFPSGCRLQVEVQIDPCVNAADELAATYGPAVGHHFVRTSFGHRGVAGIVLDPGTIRPGDTVTLVLPAPIASITT